MKAKINRGNGFRGALAYVHEKEGAEHVMGNMSGRTVAELTREFGAVKALRPDCKNPVWHCSLALPAGERLSAERWGELARDFLAEMKMDPANFLYDVVRHSDTDHDHIHIVASRIGLDGSLWHGQKDVFKAIDATQALEKRHGLTLTAGLGLDLSKEKKHGKRSHYTHTLDQQNTERAQYQRQNGLQPMSERRLAVLGQQERKGVLQADARTSGRDVDALRRPADRRGLTHGELNMAIRTETKPPRTVCQEAIDAVLRDGPMTAPAFISRLEALGVRAVPNIAATGTMNGYSFECEGVAFTGSKLGDAYKWGKLQLRGVEYVKDRDFTALADAKRLAGERIADTASAGQQQSAPGRDSAASPAVGAATGADRSPGQLSTAAGADAEQRRAARDDGLRPSDSSPARGLGLSSAGDGDADGRRDTAAHHAPRSDDTAAQRAGHGHAAELGSGRGISTGSRQDASRDHSSSAGGYGSDHRSDGAEHGSTRSQRPGAESVLSASAAAPVATPGQPGGGGSRRSDASSDWASRFRAASAAKRDAGKSDGVQHVVVKGDRARKRVDEQDRSQARQINPTVYLEAQGFEVIKQGRHLSVRLHGDEAYRCTKQDDGHWVTCDKYENGIGDNIALVRELEPGTGYSEAVYRLAGAPSVTRTLTREPAPVVHRPPPTLPPQSEDDVVRGREYLRERGISHDTIRAAEQAGMLRYTGGAVLYVGYDEAGTARNATRRSLGESDPVPRRDLFGSDKRHPQCLRGARDTVMVVEGGADALAAIDLARRERRPEPTVLVSGGANSRAWIDTPWVQAILRVAKKVIVALDREKSPEIQAKTDQAHGAQIERLQAVCRVVERWMPPAGSKDMAELNLARQQRTPEHQAFMERNQARVDAGVEANRAAGRTQMPERTADIMEQVRANIATAEQRQEAAKAAAADKPKVL